MADTSRPTDSLLPKELSDEMAQSLDPIAVIHMEGEDIDIERRYVMTQSGARDALGTLHNWMSTAKMVGQVKDNRLHITVTKHGGTNGLRSVAILDGYTDTLHPVVELMLELDTLHHAGTLTQEERFRRHADMEATLEQVEAHRARMRKFRDRMDRIQPTPSACVPVGF